MFVHFKQIKWREQNKKCKKQDYEWPEGTLCCTICIKEEMNVRGLIFSKNKKEN